MAAGFLDRRGQSPARLDVHTYSNIVARVASVLRSSGYLSVRKLMCTVSFVPKDQGFYVAMNRDEKRSRSIALPPRIVTVARWRRICEKTAADDIDRLRGLHRSHLPERGPFSICMHRTNAATVSYTEVTVENRNVTMRYKPGPPCLASPTVTKSL